MDLHMVDVAQDITYYSYADSSYAFILTPQGYTIMHPSFQRPLRTSIQPMHTDIRHFEQHAGFHAVREAILSRDRGEMMLHVETQGCFDDLSQSGVDFAELLKQPEEEEPASPSAVKELSFAPIPEVTEAGSQLSLHSIVDDYEVSANSAPSPDYVNKVFLTISFRGKKTVCI